MANGHPPSRGKRGGDLTVEAERFNVERHLIRLLYIYLLSCIKYVVIKFHDGRYSLRS
jgi:hypothetical protein